MEGDFQGGCAPLFPSVHPTEVFEGCKHHRTAGSVGDAFIDILYGKIPDLQPFSHEIRAETVAGAEAQGPGEAAGDADQKRDGILRGNGLEQHSLQVFPALHYPGTVDCRGNLLHRLMRKDGVQPGRFRIDGDLAVVHIRGRGTELDVAGKRRNSLAHLLPETGGYHEGKYYYKEGDGYRDDSHLPPES